MNYLIKIYLTCAMLLQIIGSSCAQSGQPFCIWEDQNAGQYFFSRHDASTGVLTTIAPISGLSGYASGSKTAFNADLDHYYFAGLDGVTVHYYTVDVSTGSVIQSPMFSDNVVGIEYNCNDSLLYGLRETGNFYDLVNLEPSTGSISGIGAVLSMDAYVSETFTLDPVRGLYSFVALAGGNLHLRSFNIDDASNVRNDIFPDNLIGHHFNCADSSIYALWEDGLDYKLEQVDISTGIHTTVSVLSGVAPGYVAGSSSIDQSGVYTYRGFDAGNNIALISIDVSSGTVLHITPTMDNAVGFEETMCCTEMSTVGIEQLQTTPTFIIYPNPVGNEIWIKCSEQIQEYTILDANGRTITSKALREGSFEENINILSLNTGQYIVEIRSPNGTSARSFIKE